MVYLDKIYTRSGDSGSTGLGDGTRLPKHHLRIVSYGTVDELSSVIGVALTHKLDEPHAAWLLSIQNDLFDVGSDLCRPGAEKDGTRLSPEYTTQIEEWIDEANADLAPLKTFTLPGGSVGAAWMHMARTVCRRAERHVNELCADPDEQDKVNPEVLRYLNRLSDLFFVLSRVMNDGGATDVLWVPAARKNKKKS